MKITIATWVTVVALAAAPPAPGQNVPEPVPRKAAPSPERAALQRLQAMTARFAPVPITADLSALPASERQALARIVAAARHMDAIFLRQAWAGNPSLLLDLLRDESPLGRARLRYFLINKGPWSELDKDEPFLSGIGPRPASANFYPPGATKEEVEAWMNGLRGEEQARAKGFFTTIRRDPQGRFVAVPYSIEYQGELAEAAALLQQAAALTTQPTLKAYLQKRAEAFLSNDYYASDVAWMELDASIEPTIGPYEVYEDEWLNQKAAFEAFIAIRDQAETAKLARFAGVLQELEDHLPIDPRMRNPKLGALAPIRVVNVVFTAGDANHAVQTAAYNLPNDERVVKEKGSKRVMLKNVQEAKFGKVLVPISKVALAAADRPGVSFDAFFTHILMHELMHGLGPHDIKVGGRATTVREELKDAYSALEEAKADISGLWALQYLVDKGTLDRSLERSMYTTFLASAFRTLRFGLSDSHARGMAIQLNALLDKSAFKVNADGTFAVDHARVKQAVAEVTRDLITIQGEGNAARARELLTTMAVVRPPVQRVLDRLKAVPVDIEPSFTAADELAR
jgi:peptidase M49-like protein